MAFRYTSLGAQISEDPAGAAAKLVALLIEHDGNLSKVAAALEPPVDYRTLTRWLQRLQKAGHDVRALAFDKLDEKKRGETWEPPLPDPSPTPTPAKKR